MIKTNIGKILRVAIVAGFSYVAYIVAFTLINNILPLIKNISMAQVYSINTSLLILDGIVIIIAGYIISFFSVEKFMIVCLFILVIVESVLFWIIQTASIEEINLMRILVVIFGVSFAVALEVWIANITDNCDEEKYLINGLGQSLGLEIFGRTTVIASLYYFNFAGNFMLSSVYIILLALCAIYSIYSYPKLTKQS